MAPKNEVAVREIRPEPTKSVAPVAHAEAKPAPKATPTKQPEDVRSVARRITVRHFGEGQWPPMERLIMKESGFNPKAVNRSSGACGLPQALPCGKIPGGLNASVETQVEWMNTYVKNRYGNPSNALNFHQRNNWY